MFKQIFLSIFAITVISLSISAQATRPIFVPKNAADLDKHCRTNPQDCTPTRPRRVTDDTQVGVWVVEYASPTKPHFFKVILTFPGNFTAEQQKDIVLTLRSKYGYRHITADATTVSFLSRNFQSPQQVSQRIVDTVYPGQVALLIGGSYATDGNIK